MLIKLLDGHARLREISRAIERIIGGPAPGDRTELSRLRWHFTREILQHLDLEDRVAFVGLLRDPRPDAVRVAAEFKTGLQPLYEDYQHHMRRWQGNVEEHDWADYCQSTFALLKRLEQRMHDEETRLYPYLRPDEAELPRIARVG